MYFKDITLLTIVSLISFKILSFQQGHFNKISTKKLQSHNVIVHQLLIYIIPNSNPHTSCCNTLYKHNYFLLQCTHSRRIMSFSTKYMMCN